MLKYAVIKSLSPQEVAAYKELLIKGPSPITAKDLAEKLNVLPNSIYRSLACLGMLGMIEELSNHPKKFKAKAPSAAISTYLLAHRNWFERHFPASKTNDDQTNLGISFIQNRGELMEQSIKDTGHAKKEICLLISGHGIDPENLLQNKRALERGVKMKILSQRSTLGDNEMFENWQRMGMEVRFGETIGARLFIFDSEIVYITSYSLEQKDKAIGVRFAYPPIAKLLREVFESQWSSARKS